MARPTDKGLITKSKLTAIGAALRKLFGGTKQYTPDEMATAINGIEKKTSSDLTVSGRSTRRVLCHRRGKEHSDGCRKQFDGCQRRRCHAHGRSAGAGSNTISQRYVGGRWLFWRSIYSGH